MPFKDLDEFLVVKPNVLPIRGKDYSFPGEISARSWLRLQRLSERIQQARQGDFDPDEEVVSDIDQAELMAEIFGGVDEQLAADDCTSAQIKLVFYTLMAWHISGREAAETVWEARGETVAPNRAARRHPAKSTPSRGSRAGSTAPKAAVPPGSASSDTGP